MTGEKRTQRVKSEILATAAEAFAAAQFVRFGYDVSVQYGATQPECDLIIAEGGRILKISVQGSADGSWNFTQSAQSDLSTASHANSHTAVDLWLEGHKAGTAICLVQLKDVDNGALPRAYLAWPLEIAAKLKAASDGRGDTVLWETPPDIAGAGTAGGLLDEWKMTRERVEELMNGDAAANP